MRLPQSVKRSMSSRVLCCGPAAPCASSSSSVESEGLGCSGSGGGVGGRPAGASGEAGLGGKGNMSVLGVGWLVTKEEDEGDGGGLRGVALICSTWDSPVKNSKTNYLCTSEASKCHNEKKFINAEKVLGAKKKCLLDNFLERRYSI